MWFLAWLFDDDESVAEFFSRENNPGLKGY